MNLESLNKRRSDVEARFNKENDLKTKVEQETYRLQGEYRLLNELISELTASEADKKEKK